MAIQYVFKDDQPLGFKNSGKANAQAIGDALEKITEAHGGKLTPRVALDAAKAPRHPLHKHFEWDDEKAANAHRLDQARSLIRSICIVSTTDNEPKNIPVFVSITQRDGISYRRLSDVALDADLSNALLKQAEKDLAAWEARYARLADVCSIVADARAKLRERYATAEKRPQ